MTPWPLSVATEQQQIMKNEKKNNINNSITVKFSMAENGNGNTEKEQEEEVGEKEKIKEQRNSGAAGTNCAHI